LANNLKTKYAPVLSSLIAVGFAMHVSPANAGESEIDETKNSVQTLESSRTTNTRKYALELTHLACLYWKDNQSKEAEIVLRKAVKAADGRPEKIRLVAEILMSFAEYIADMLNYYQPESLNVTASKFQTRRAEGLSLARKSVTEAMIAVRKLPRANAERIKLTFNAINICKLTNLKQERKILIAELDETLRQQESQMNLSFEERKNCAYALDNLAQIFVPEMEPEIAKLYRHNSQPLAPLWPQDLRRAEILKLRSISQWDKLPEKNEARIAALRDFIRWCQLNGLENQEKIQTEKLGKLLKTTDPDILFPSPRHGCGGPSSRVFCGLG
jgi:hypothetical protein